MEDLSTALLGTIVVDDKPSSIGKNRWHVCVRLLPANKREEEGILISDKFIKSCEEIYWIRAFRYTQRCWRIEPPILHPFGFAKRAKDLNTASQNAHTLKGQQTLRPKKILLGKSPFECCGVSEWDWLVLMALARQHYSQSF